MRTEGAAGLRLSRNVGATVPFVWDEQNVLTDHDPNGGVMYAQLPGVWGGLFSFRRCGQSRFYLPDFAATTRQLTDSSGNVTDTLLTDAWGVEIASTVDIMDWFRAFGQFGYYRSRYVLTRWRPRARRLRRRGAG